jgi:hypothetical protein
MNPVAPRGFQPILIQKDDIQRLAGVAHEIGEKGEHPIGAIRGIGAQRVCKEAGSDRTLIDGLVRQNYIGGLCIIQLGY